MIKENVNDNDLNSQDAAEKLQQFHNLQSKSYVGWDHILKAFFLPHKWFYEYYRYGAYKDSATPEMWNSWKFVWHFKNDPDKSISESDHNVALNKAIRLVEDQLRETFGSDVSLLTLVCITASTKKKNDARFKDFADRVCRDLNMENAYSHINIISDGDAKHEGGTELAEKSYDIPWFKGKFIVLFDDVCTSGEGICREKRILESMGAKIICAITLAKTFS
jgi:hypothetical protein